MEEHNQFLEAHNAGVLRQQSDSTSYLSSVGEEAAEMYDHLMSKHNNSKEVQKLPHPERVRELHAIRRASSA